MFIDSIKAHYTSTPIHTYLHPSAQQGAERPPAEDALHRLREWLHSLPQQMRFKDAAGMASQEHTLVLEWTQDVDSSQVCVGVYWV